MTRLEQLKAINERIGPKLAFDEPAMVSVMLIAYSLDNLHKLGLIQAPFAISDMGKDVVAVCEEFGWEVTDAEIEQFCLELVPKEQYEAFVFFLKSSRDGTLGATNE